MNKENEKYSIEKMYLKEFQFSMVNTISLSTLLTLTLIK